MKRKKYFKEMFLLHFSFHLLIYLIVKIISNLLQARNITIRAFFDEI